MATSVNFQKQFDALHRDAERVLASINHLTQDLGAEAPEKVTSFSLPELNMEKLKVDMAGIRKRLDETRGVVADRAKQIDSQVHARPYPYLAGALGLGAIAGWMLERRINHSSVSAEVPCAKS